MGIWWIRWHVYVTEQIVKSVNQISLSMYYDILIHICMKQDQSYSKQVFYLREDNFGLNIKKNVALKITCKIVAFVYWKSSFKHWLPKQLREPMCLPWLRSCFKGKKFCLLTSDLEQFLLLLTSRKFLIKTLPLCL